LPPPQAIAAVRGTGLAVDVGGGETAGFDAPRAFRDSWTARSQVRGRSGSPSMWLWRRGRVAAGP
jgi:hypothetical protein